MDLLLGRTTRMDYEWRTQDDNSLQDILILLEALFALAKSMYRLCT